MKNDEIVLRSEKNKMSIRTKLSLLFLMLFSCCIHPLAMAQYKISDIVNTNKLKITAPYKYDGFLMNEFKFDLINKNLHNEFIAFKDQKYKLLFCSSDFDETVTIRVYNKKSPTVLVAEKTIDGTTKNWTFEPPIAGTYSIIYEISPSNTEVVHAGCVVMLIGFSNK
jgi:hypothetical protein